MMESGFSSEEKVRTIGILAKEDSFEVLKMKHLINKH